MKKTDSTLFNMHIRPIEPKDFSFIRSLAAEFPAFTVPSDYVLWFLTRFHPDYCRVIEQRSGVLKAYLLAMPTSSPRDGIAIWQAAAAESDRAFTLEFFAAYLRDLVGHTGVKSVFFSMPNDPAALRLINSLAKQFANCEIERLNSVPAGQNEFEFRLSLEASKTGKT